MIRVTYALRRRRDMSSEDFHGYWRERHGPLVASYASVLGIRRYVQTHLLPDDPLNGTLRAAYGTSEDLFDGVAELWLNTEADRAAAASSANGREAGIALVEDESHFIDFSRSIFMFGTEVPQINPVPENLIASPATPIVKFMSFLWQKPELSFESSQLHWRMNHGPLVRQYAQTFGFRRYIQVHRHNTKIADRMRAARVDMPDPPVFGHAEIWFDRHEFAAAQGPELEKAFELGVEDTNLFIDLPNSVFFVGKEHVLVDRPVVTEPIPGPPDI